MVRKVMKTEQVGGRRGRQTLRWRDRVKIDLEKVGVTSRENRRNSRRSTDMESVIKLVENNL